MAATQASIPSIPQPLQALVARFSVDDACYLQLGPGGAQQWVTDAAAATPFGSMREATRAALRLPARLRAFSLPQAPVRAAA